MEHSYGSIPALRNISLSVESGEFHGLVGPNGSGKSTLLKIILGLLAPDSGKATLFGEPATDFAEGHRLGYVAQDATRRDQNMPITVREVVRMGRYPHIGLGRVSNVDRSHVERAIARVDLSDLASRRMNALSGGQRQRVFIARALAAEADLLALDEPTVGIDIESKRAFYRLLKQLNSEGLTILLIEHDIGIITEFTSHVTCINTELYHHGTVGSFVESRAMTDSYGGQETFHT